MRVLWQSCIRGQKCSLQNQIRWHNTWCISCWFRYHPAAAGPEGRSWKPGWKITMRVKCGEVKEDKEALLSSDCKYNSEPYLWFIWAHRDNLRLNFLRKSETRLENNHSCLFLKRSRDVGHHKDWGSTFLRAGVSFLSFRTLYLLHAAVNGTDASLCVGRWRDCFPSLMKGGCWGLIPGYLGHWYALEASTGIVWCQRRGQTQRLGGGCFDRLLFSHCGQLENYKV